jgi:site-specific DNA-methyltransferase (adenine-specific)
VTPYYEDDHCTIYHGDCREILPTLEPAPLLLTDPPYGIPAGSAVWRKNGTAIEDWGTVGHNAEVTGWREAARLAVNAWVVEFGVRAGDGFGIAAAHQSAGWQPSQMYALVKSAPAPSIRPTFASALELACISRVGAPKWHGTGYVPNRWIGLTPNRAGTDHGHPTEKPLEPFHALIGALSAPGDVVLDPFLGSGTTARAAKDLGRRCIGIELEERYCEIAVNRLAQEVLPL